ncbi:MAG: hypothetical protein V3S51_01465 [Dehalococcoidia bacterium]
MRFEGKAIAKVGYSLHVELEDLVAKTFNGRPKALLRQTKFITGRISVSEGDFGLGIAVQDSPDALTLLMDDGRELDFHIVDPALNGSEYLIQGSGDFRQIQR